MRATIGAVKHIVWLWIQTVVSIAVQRFTTFGSMSRFDEELNEFKSVK